MHHYLGLTILTLIISMGFEGSVNGKPMPRLPCDGDFELKVNIDPVDRENGDPVGLVIKYKDKGGRGLASRTHTSQSVEFDAAACSRWQKQTWSFMKRLQFENSRPERREFVCHDIARIDYRLGANHVTSKMCLSNAKDGLTYGFGKFYEGTDRLVER